MNALKMKRTKCPIAYKKKSNNGKYYDINRRKRNYLKKPTVEKMMENKQNQQFFI